MRKALIDSHIRILCQSLGKVRSPVDDVSLERDYRCHDYARMAGSVKRILKIETRVRLGLANSGGPAQAPAWIEYPMPTPMFGSSSFNAMSVTVYLRKSFLKHAPFETIVIGLAHEFCHLVLDSTGNPLRRSEEAVDLTAMLLGFRDFFVTGCVHTYNVEGTDYRQTVGYLSPKEVMYAAQAMTYR